MRKASLNISKPWLTSYPPGVPEFIDADKYENIPLLIDEACQKFSERVAFENFGAQLTFKAMKNLSDATAAWLQSQSFEQGDRVAIMMPNCLAYPVILHSILKAGLCVVNINPQYSVRELKHVLNDSKAKLIFLWEGSAHTLSITKIDAPIKLVLVTIGDLMGIKGIAINAVIRYVKKAVKPFSMTSAIPFSEVIKLGKKRNLHQVKINSTDTAFFQYTGGTTGASKAAILTHRNLIANTEQADAYLNPTLTRADKQITIIAPLPLYHIFSLMVNGILMPKLGALNVLITNPKDISSFIKTLSSHKFNALPGVNTLFAALLDHPNFASVDFSHLQLTLGGGMAVQSNTARQWQSTTGCPIHQAYGLTETSPGVCVMPHTNLEFSGSIGLPLPSTEVVIFDDFNNPQPTGEIGELCVRGPQVMQGYWQENEDIEDTDHTNWLRTGDIAKIDENGYVYIVDRKNDMILTSGFNVYPNEIEDVLTSHPAIKECGCIGVDDERSGQIVKAYIVFNASFAATDEELKAFCETQLTSYKIPKLFESIDALPKNNVGKVLRRELRTI